MRLQGPSTGVKADGPLVRDSAPEDGSRVPRCARTPLRTHSILSGIAFCTHQAQIALHTERISGVRHAALWSGVATRPQGNEASGLANVRFCVKLPGLRHERPGGAKKPNGRFKARVKREPTTDTPRCHRLRDKEA